MGVACEGCLPLADLVKRYDVAGGKYFVCPICFDARHLDKTSLIAGAELQGTVPMWAWIGDEGATTFSYWARHGPPVQGDTRSPVGSAHRRQ